MNALDRAGVRQGVVEPAATRFRGGQGEHGAQPFSAGEETVSHRFVNCGRPRAGPRQKPIQRAINGGGAFVEITSEVHPAEEWKGAGKRGRGKSRRTSNRTTLPLHAAG